MKVHNPQQDPKDILWKSFLIALMMVIALFVLHGCKATPTENSQTKQTDTQTQNDTLNKTTINGAVTDSLKIAIPTVRSAKPECDSLLQIELERTLELLNSYKKSGENEQGIRYNALKKQLEMWQKMAQTKNESVKIVYRYKYLKSEAETKEIPVKYIPWWVKYLAWIGGITVVYLGYRVSRTFFWTA